MTYAIEFQNPALKDLDQLSPDVARRIIEKIELLKHDLLGDVKRLRNFSPRFRLRVGDWRVLFEISEEKIYIWRIRHRSEVYDR